MLKVKINFELYYFVYYDNEGAYDYGYNTGRTGDTPDLTIYNLILIIPKSQMDSNRPVCLSHSGVSPAVTGDVLFVYTDVNDSHAFTDVQTQDEQYSPKNFKDTHLMN